MGRDCGREGGGQDGVEWGGKWDNCNSIMNKYIKKKKEPMPPRALGFNEAQSCHNSSANRDLSTKTKNVAICTTQGFR